MFDIIGDIHGHADELTALLEKLGYRQSAGVYRHPERTAVFLGDFIDRGPKIRETLCIVRPMVESQAAHAIMGNHEWNALGFHTVDPKAPAGHLRRRTVKNIRQHAQTILQLNDDELASALAWFRTLPLWLDLDGIRVVHACWDEPSIGAIEQGLTKLGGVTAAFLESAGKKEGAHFEAVETVLKGPEICLPNGLTIKDKDGHVRSTIRTRWHEPAAATYGAYAFQAEPVECEVELDSAMRSKFAGYPPAAKPVFFGHYWLRAARPEALAGNVACLDFSVAKGGMLCAYRWHGEMKLSNDHFVWVDAA